MITKTIRTGPGIGLALFLGIAMLVTIATGRSTAYAADGDLDPTFDGDGRVTTDYINTHDEVRAVAIQPDGKIVTAGTTLISGTNPHYNFPHYNFAVARYNPNGTPDTSFSFDGKLTTDFFLRNDGAYAIAIQTDGKIVAVGATLAGDDSAFAVARYTPDGSLDTTFDGDGMANYFFCVPPSCPDFDLSGANGVALQDDGKIVLAGYTSHGGGSTNFGLIRLNSDGSLDTTFDGDGVVITNFFGGVDEARAVAIQANGKIVAVGNAQVSISDYDFAAARYNVNGSLDNGFDNDGKATADYFDSDDGAYGMALQPDGKIVAAGGAFINEAASYNFAVVRWTSTGNLDNTFDGDGRFTNNLGGSGGSDSARAVAIQADGKIVAAGYAPVGGVNRFALLRLNPNGTLDPGFNGDGIVTSDFGGGVAISYDVAIQADGKIVAAGAAFMGTSDYDLAVARYLLGGAPTQTPTRTPTRTPTNTPTFTHTPLPPTQTPGGPSATPIPTNTPGGQASSTPTVCPIQFTDVLPGSTFYDFVRCMACRNIINGYSSGCELGNPCFRPNNNVTRGQLSKIVSNSAGYIEDHANQSFEDAPVGSTFHLFIERLFSRGHISGYACGGAGEPCVPPGNRPYFRPNANVTRGQTSKIVASARGLPAPPSGQTTFEDVAEGSTFWEWIEALATNGAISGYACGNPEPCVPPLNRSYFRPNNQVTRGQSAKIVANAFFPGCVTPQK